MSSHFDDAFAEADDILFDTFGEKDQPQYFPPGSAHGQPVKVVLHRNLQMVGAGGVFMVVQLAVDIRKAQVSAPQRKAVLVMERKRYVLEEPLLDDALITRYSLNLLD